MLQMLRERSLLLHSADVVEMPTMFSYAHVVHRNPLREAQGASRRKGRKGTPVFVTRFGVSAPNQTHLGRGLGLANGLAAVVRAYRVRRGWGLLGVNPDAELPPSPTTGWPHGHCAEMQAIPPIVEWCESLSLENITIYSLTVHKSGAGSAAMCSNCRAYISIRVLKRHPSWKVVDVHSSTTLSIRPG